MSVKYKFPFKEIVVFSTKKNKLIIIKKTKMFYIYSKFFNFYTNFISTKEKKVNIKA